MGTKIRKSHEFTFDIQPLERRLMLAGNVTAVVNGAGNLIIRGDAEANELQIVSARTPGTFLVQGADTTVNGEGSFLASGVTGGMNIRLKGGDDVLHIRAQRDDLNSALADGGFQLTGRLLVHTGIGDDSVVIDGAGRINPESFGESTTNMELGDVKMLTKSGDDFVSVNGVLVQGNIDIGTKTGSDTVEVSNLSMGEGDCKITIRTCSGIDTICMYNIGAEGTITIAGGGSSDTMIGAEFLPETTTYRSIEEFEFKFDQPE